MKKTTKLSLLLSIFLLFSLLTACDAVEEWWEDDDYYAEEDDGYDDYENEEQYDEDYGEESEVDNQSESETESTQAENTREAGELSTSLRDFVENIMQEDHLPGAAVAVISGNEIIFAEGFGLRDVEANLPVTNETLFHIGSTNKSMTAMMIATLVDEGLFDWDTPVVEIYPDFALENPESTETVTMRHLLGMQSGIPDAAEDDFDVDNASGEEVFDYVANVQLLGDPGDEFSYSNISASLAGYLGVIASGESADLYSGYASLLQKQVLAPIGMNASVVRFSDAQRSPHYSKSYYLEGSEAVEAEREDFDGDPLAPSGALKANVDDMAAYMLTQLRGGIAPNGTRVVSEENLAETWKPALENYGMGWESSEYEGITLISHEGSFDNFLSVIGFSPDLEMAFVVLTNAEDAGGRLIEELPTFLLDHFLEK